MTGQLRGDVVSPSRIDPARWWGVGTLGGAIVVLVLCAPLLYYPGDNFAPRAEAAWLLNTGEYGIPLSARDDLDELALQRGQYFFENDERGRFYSKYGAAYTLLALPPLAVERALSGELRLLHRSGSLLILLDLWVLLFAILVLVLLWKITGLFASGGAVRSAFVVATCFGTFLFYYLRCHAHDVYQLAAFLGVVWYALRFSRQFSGAPGGTEYRNLVLAGVCLGALVHMRFSYVILYGPLLWLVISSGTNGWAGWSTIQRNGRSYWLPLGIPAVVTVGLLLFVQAWKFGSPLSHGYSQWGPHEANPLLVPVPVLLRTLNLYFVAPGNGNALIHYPLFLLALPAWPLFFRQHRRESIFVWMLFACVLLPVLHLASEGYGYGPRYLLPALVLCSLPVLNLGAVLRSKPRAVRVVAATLAVGVLAVSCLLNCYMNAIHYYAAFQIKAELRWRVGERAEREELEEVLGRWHHGLLHRDLLAWRRGAPFPPLQVTVRAAPPERRAQVRRELEQFLLRFTASNYLWFPPPPVSQARRTEGANAGIQLESDENTAWTRQVTLLPPIAPAQELRTKIDDATAQRPKGRP